MMNIFNLLLRAGIVGLLSAIVVSTAVFYWNSEKPLKGLSTREAESTTTRRVMCCVCIVTALLYAALTYWWPSK